MEATCTDLTERILRLTLEIIYLLTGEDNIVVTKTSGDGQSPVMVPLQSLLISDRNNEQKILEVTQKIIELLTGENENWSNFNVVIKEEIKDEEEEDGVMKEREYLEGHKDLYKDVMMEDQPHLISLDGSSNGKPPERCPRPLSSHRDSTQEDLTIPHHHQGVEVFAIKTEVKEEEEMYERGNQLSVKEDEMMVTITKEETSLDDSTREHKGWNSRVGRRILSARYNKDNNDMNQYSPGASVPSRNLHPKRNRMAKSADSGKSRDQSHTTIPDFHPSFHGTEKSPDPSNPQESSPDNCQVFQDWEKSFIKKHYLVVHHRMHASEKPFWCFECEKSFTRKSNLIDHQKIHSSEKPFACTECGKSFIKKSHLMQHQRIHTGEKPFSCTECGKSFIEKSKLNKHLRVHTGEKPFSCFECGKSFSDKGNCDRHVRSHFPAQIGAKVSRRKNPIIHHAT